MHNHAYYTTLHCPIDRKLTHGKTLTTTLTKQNQEGTADLQRKNLGPPRYYSQIGSSANLQAGHNKPGVFWITSKTYTFFNLKSISTLLVNSKAFIAFHIMLDNHLIYKRRPKSKYKLANL